MIYHIEKSKLSGKIILPSSKSVAARLIFSSIFSNKITKFSGFGLSEDINVYFNAVKLIKPESKIKIFNNNRFLISIEGNYNENLFIKSKSPLIIFDCKDSAFCLRALSIIGSYFSTKLALTGSKQLFNRPVNIILNTLKQAKVKAKYIKSKRTLIIENKIQEGKFFLDTKISTQHISGLLMTLPFLNKDSQIVLKNYYNGSFIDLTIDILKKGGVSIEKEKIINMKNNEYFIEKYIIKGNSTFDLNNYIINSNDYKSFIQIESDWSSASFFMVAASLSGPITFYNLNINSIQPDVKIIEILRLVGAKIEISCQEKNNINKNNKNTTYHSITIKRNKLNPFIYDISNCPDLFPIISVLACFCEGSSRIYGIKRLKYKESDRIRSIYVNLKRLGIKIKVESSYVEINGSLEYLEDKIYKNKSKIILDSFDDHRIFMALTIFATFFNKNIIIKDNQSYKKSFPQFIEYFKILGGIII
ncbi:MAG: 3-phosphoshikimate 1-carboxyvinyltransferase [Exilispira sp.]